MENAATTRPDDELSTMAARFTEAWAHPEPDRLVALLDPDVRLLQPVTPELRGKEAARREFTRLLRWLPDLHGVIDSTAGTGDTLLVAWHLRFTLARRPRSISIVDRIVVRGGVIVEREAYFDSLRFLLLVLASPSEWIGYARYRGFLPG
jgi:ketosteroid isomerase-like protein